MSAQILLPKIDKIEKKRKVGFVGPEELTLLKAGLSLGYVKEFCRKLMLKELEKGSYIFVSGGCPKKGIDIICEEIADSLGIKKEIYAPEHKGWEDQINWQKGQPVWKILHEKPRKRLQWFISKDIPHPTCAECGNTIPEHPLPIGIHLVSKHGLPNDFILKEHPIIEIVPEVEKGYRSRNIGMAKAFDIGYCITPKDEKAYCHWHKTYGHVSSGGCFTILEGEKLGKEVHLVVIE